MPFEVDARGITRMADKLDRLGKEGEREQQRAMQDARRSSLTFVGRDIRKEYPVKVAAIKKSISATPVKNLIYTISGSPKSISLKHFGRLNQTKKGVAVTIRRGARTLYRSAFQVGTRGGQVFWRKKIDGKPVGRLPILKLAGPAASQMFDEAQRIQRTQRFVSERIAAGLTRRYNRIIKRG